MNALFVSHCNLENPIKSNKIQTGFSVPKSANCYTKWQNVLEIERHYNITRL